MAMLGRRFFSISPSRSGNPAAMSSVASCSSQAGTPHRRIPHIPTWPPIRILIAFSESYACSYPLPENEKWPREPEKGKSSARSAMRGSEGQGPTPARSAGSWFHGSQGEESRPSRNRFSRMTKTATAVTLDQIKAVGELAKTIAVFVTCMRCLLLSKRSAG